MRKLTPRRRVAVLAGACAAIVPSAAMLMEHSPSKPLEFTGGLLVGLACTLAIGLFIRTRRACS